MTEGQLETRLREWYRAEVNAAPVPESLRDSVVAVPDAAPATGRVGLGRRVAFLAAAALLVTALAAGTIAIGSGLVSILRLDASDPRPFTLASQPCALVSAGFEAVVIPGGQLTRSSGSLAYSDDWHVPQEAVEVLGPDTRRCNMNYAAPGRGRSLTHFEVFVRARATERDEARELATALFDGRVDEGLLLHRWPVWSFTGTGRDGRFPEGHGAVAFLRDSTFVVVSFSEDGEPMPAMRLVEHVAGRLGLPISPSAVDP